MSVTGGSRSPAAGGHTPGTSGAAGRASRAELRAPVRPAGWVPVLGFGGHLDAEGPVCPAGVSFLLSRAGGTARAHPVCAGCGQSGFSTAKCLSSGGFHKW